MDNHTSFDLERLRLSQDFPSQVGVKKALLTVPVRKPDRQWFIRVHPDLDWRLETAVLELKEERETYIVDPDMWPELPGELVPKVLFTAINRAISEFPKGRKYLISLSFRGKASVRPAQVGGFDVNIVIHGSTAVRGRGDLVAYRWALWKLTAPWTHRTRPPHLGKRCAFSTSSTGPFPSNHSRKTPKGPKIALGNPDRPINRQGVVFLWPVRLPGEDGRGNAWHRSALQAADLAMKGWVKVAANMSLGAYEAFEATGDLPEPEWPDRGFSSLVDIAFKDYYVRSLDHPVIQRLKGAL